MRSKKSAIRLGISLILVLLAVYNYARYIGDNRVFARISSQVCNKGMPARQRLDALVAWAREDIAPRRSAPFVPPPASVRILEKLFTPFPRRALKGRLHCGSASNLFCAVAATAGLRTRTAFLHQDADVTGRSPSHVVVECLVDGRWVVVDPLFGLLVRLPDGEPVTVEDLDRKPQLLTSAVPDDYPLDVYNYHYVTRVNWHSVPVVLPLVYRALHAIVGDAVNEIALPAIRRRPRLQLMLLSLLTALLLAVTPSVWGRWALSRRLAREHGHKGTGFRIAFVVEDAHRQGGTERVAFELARRFAERHQVHVFGYSVAPELAEKVVFHPLPRTPGPAVWQVLVFSAMTTLAVPRRAFDFVIGQGANCFVADVVIAHQCRAALREKAALLPRSGVTESLARRAGHWLHDAAVVRLERWIYRDPSRRRIIAVSEGLRHDLKRFYADERGEIAVVQNGVDLDEFTPANRECFREDVRRKLGVTPETTVLLFVGGDWPRKGVAFAISSLAHLQEMDVRLVVVGNGAISAYQAFADANGVADRVVFTGMQADCRPYYAAADIFVLPTCYESFSLVVLEAAASGLPLLVTRVNGALEVVRDGKNGYFIEQDGADIAGKVRDIVSSGRLQEMSSAARDTATHFTWSRMANRVEEELRKLVEQTP